MKKPLQGDGMAFSEMLYGNEADINVASPSNKNNCLRTCPGPKVALKDARNLAKASRDLNTVSNTSYQIFQHLKGKYCDKCSDKFKKTF